MITAYSGAFMKKMRFLLSLTNNDNDYQLEQSAAGQRAAQKLGIELELIHASNDGIVQSQQLLNRIQSTTTARPDAIIFEPAGATALPHVARAAAAAGIGWAVVNRDADYVAELRRTYQVPVFCITSDHEEIGRIQGRQLVALLPEGGSVLYIQGPSEHLAAKQRLFGMLETKPDNIQLRNFKAQWTEASAQKSVTSWLRLATARDMKIDAVCAQDDSMAMGARKAIEQCEHRERERWLRVPFLGCDGLPRTGQEWVRQKLLTATVHIPASAGDAIELMARWIETGTISPERTFTSAKSIPPIEALAERVFRARSGAR